MKLVRGAATGVLSHAIYYKRVNQMALLCGLVYGYRFFSLTFKTQWGGGFDAISTFDVVIVLYMYAHMYELLVWVVHEKTF